MDNEARLIIDLTRGGEVDRGLPAGETDWGRLLRTARANRVQGLVFDGLDRNDLTKPAPETVRTALERDYFRDVKFFRAALDLASHLAENCAAAGVPLLILRGPALGLTVYPRPYLRPFSDLDLLVLKPDLPRAREIIEEAGFRPLPGLLPERYFERHHLHLNYRHRETGLKAELHWALDHPYTLTRVEYPELFSRRREVSFEGKTIPVLSPPDRVLSLSLHLLKHCPFLPEMLEEGDLPSLILRGRWLLWILDIHRALLLSREELDLPSLAKEARLWNLERETAAAISAAAAIYGEVPGRENFPDLRAKKISLLRRELYRRQLVYLNDRAGAGRLTRSLFGLRGEGVFRPVRLLDLSAYLLPGRGWLESRYRVRGPAVIPAALFHAARGLARLGVNLLDYLYCRFRPW